MRVIAGKYKGTKLVSPRGEVRPTTDIVKGSLFSVLGSKGMLAGARCLDVFCGSGGLGIEALSRGAESCVFADLYLDNVTANLKKLRITARTERGDFKRTLKRLCGEKFDLIFCDPPYSSGYARTALELIISYELLTEHGAAVVERASDGAPTEVAGARITDSRTFGAATFEIIGVDHESNIRGDV